MRGFVFAAVAALLVASSAIAAENLCESDKRVVASCFDVHGRLRINANLRLYMWPVGTDRMLTVHYANDRPEADPPLPAKVAEIMKPGADVFADYRVCPMTRYEPGKRQTVCVSSASRIVIRPNGN
jgi:hypothetical protein